ncbi:MAG: alpha/beta hydrolase [Tannerellaceae bacterium]|nr:alpha/beta hydrolase [Tannerellaceae bacterium]
MNTLKTIFTVLFALATGTVTAQNDALRFNPGMDFSLHELTLPTGETVKFRAYEKLYFVSSVEDSAYQYLHFFVPELPDCNVQKAPVFLRTYIGGYAASKAVFPSPDDAGGYALREGFVVVIPGSRGRNSKAGGILTGKAPAGLLDLKAAVRFLRYNDKQMPGDAEKIVTDGTSAGGAMSALLGATGNNPLYEPYLKKMGAAQARDDVFATVCYCPITDLEHADMAYEWLYGCTNVSTRNLSPEQTVVSNALAERYPEYLNGLNLKTPDGAPLTAENYLPYLKSFLIASAQKAKDAGADLPSGAGIVQSGDFVVDIDWEHYLNYVVRKEPLKTPPAFDSLGVPANSRPSNANDLFGDLSGEPVNFTGFSLQRATGNPSATLSADIQARVILMNPMYFIGDGKSKTAPHWYIRHGAIDRNTGFQIPVNLYTKLLNNGFHPNFALAWNRPHSGDYALRELFAWLNEILGK